jgi:CBS domain-containing protein
MLRKLNVGAIPVVTDHDSRRLIGIVTDRDLCCTVVANALDPRTPIESTMSVNPVSCDEGATLDDCERLMQERQVRRIPIVDGVGRVIGIVSLADLTRKDEPEKVAKTVAEVSKPQSSAPVGA